MTSTRGLLLGLLLCLAPAAAHAARGRATAGRGRSAMATIPAGRYRPLYASAGERVVTVRSFRLDRLPVTRAEYLAFVTAHPEWRRGAVRPLFAERGYLAGWPGATNAGEGADLRRPVTGVSWHAARAYCAAAGKRLPTVDEWEYAAAASETSRDASASPAFHRRLLALYAARRPGTPAVAGSGFTNAYGVGDMHGVVWEWTLDFDSVMAGDDSRASGGGQDARDHHLFCASAAIGATDPANYAAFARFAVRAGLSARSTINGVGFRCAADAPVR